MGSDLTGRQPSCFHGLIMASPSWFAPLHKDRHARFRLLDSEGDACGVVDGSRSRRWRNLLRRLRKEGKGGAGGPKPLTFHYDIVSYSKNFDDGCCWEVDSSLGRTLESSDARAV